MRRRSRFAGGWLALALWAAGAAGRTRDARPIDYNGTTKPCSQPRRHGRSASIATDGSRGRAGGACLGLAQAPERLADSDGVRREDMERFEEQWQLRPPAVAARRAAPRRILAGIQRPAGRRRLPSEGTVLLWLTDATEARGMAALRSAAPAAAALDACGLIEAAPRSGTGTRPAPGDGQRRLCRRRGGGGRPGRHRGRSTSRRREAALGRGPRRPGRGRRIPNRSRHVAASRMLRVVEVPPRAGVRSYEIASRPREDARPSSPLVTPSAT